MLMKEAEKGLEEARGAIRGLAGQRAKLYAGAQAAEERSLAVRARLPDLEAGKKAAASARVSTYTISPRCIKSKRAFEKERHVCKLVSIAPYRGWHAAIAAQARDCSQLSPCKEEL